MNYQIERVYIPFDFICEYKGKGASESLMMKGDGVAELQKFFNNHPSAQIHLYARTGEYPSQHVIHDILKCLSYFKIAVMYGMDVFAVDWKTSILVYNPSKYRPVGVPDNSKIIMEDHLPEI